jgi:hypothetical protein
MLSMRFPGLVQTNYARPNLALPEDNLKVISFIERLGNSTDLLLRLQHEPQTVDRHCRRSAGPVARASGYRTHRMLPPLQTRVRVTYLVVSDDFIGYPFDGVPFDAIRQRARSDDNRFCL